MRMTILIVGVLLSALVSSASAQMTYRLRGTVKDTDGKPVAGAKVRAEALDLQAIMGTK